MGHGQHITLSTYHGDAHTWPKHARTSSSPPPCGMVHDNGTSHACLSYGVLRPIPWGYPRLDSLKSQEGLRLVLLFALRYEQEHHSIAQLKELLSSS